MLALGALAATLAWLVAGFGGVLPDALYQTVSSLPIPLLVLVAAVVLIGMSLRASGRSSALRQAAFLVPCCLAPSALLHPWSLAPSHLPGVGWGGPALFLEWLTKYPNFGPVNLEVLAGLAALLVVAVLPAVLALLLLSRAGRFAPGLIGTGVIVSVTWAAYVPVAVRLDAGLVLAAWFASQGDAPLFLMYGPLTRFLAATSMVALMFPIRRV